MAKDDKDGADTDDLKKSMKSWDKDLKSLSKYGDQIDGMQDEALKLLQSGDPKDQVKAQKMMQDAQDLMQTMTDILKTQSDMMKSVVQNLK